MPKRIIFQWIENCANERLRVAQQHLMDSLVPFDIEPVLYPVGRALVKFGDILRFAREHHSGDCFIWANSDVSLVRDPFELDHSLAHGFHRTERPSGEICYGVDMYMIPNRLWDERLSRDIPDLWCGATHIDWWLTRAAQLEENYEAHTGFIDHLSHEPSGASKGAADPYYRHNVREYNAWAARQGAGLYEEHLNLPFIGASLSPITDYLMRLTGRRKK